MSEVAKGTITGKSVPEDISKYCRLTLDDGHDYITKDKDVRVALEVAEMGDYAEIEYRRIEKKDKSGQFNAIDKLILKGKTTGGQEEAKVIEVSADNKNKSYALSYAKDLIVPSVTPDKPLTEKQVDTIMKLARKFEAYLNEKGA